MFKLNLMTASGQILLTGRITLYSLSFYEYSRTSGVLTLSDFLLERWYQVEPRNNFELVCVMLCTCWLWNHPLSWRHCAGMAFCFRRLISLNRIQPKVCRTHLKLWSLDGLLFALVSSWASLWLTRRNNVAALLYTYFSALPERRVKSLNEGTSWSTWSTALAACGATHAKTGIMISICGPKWYAAPTTLSYR